MHDQQDNAQEITLKKWHTKVVQNSVSMNGKGTMDLIWFHNWKWASVNITHDAFFVEKHWFFISFYSMTETFNQATKHSISTQIKSISIPSYITITSYFYSTYTVKWHLVQTALHLQEILINPHRLWVDNPLGFRGTKRQINPLILGRSGQKRAGNRLSEPRQYPGNLLNHCHRRSN